MALNSLYRADSIATSLGASAAASLLARLIGSVRGVALAWLIPQAQFGLFGVALLIVNVLLPLCSAGLYEGVMRYAPLHESSGTLRRFIIRSAILVVGIAVATTVILGLFAGPVGSALFAASHELGPARPGTPGFAGSAQLVGFTALTRASLVCVLGLAAYQTLLSLLKGLRMFRALSVAELATASLFTLFALIVALSGFTSATALVVAYAIACFAAVLFFAPGLIARVARSSAAWPSVLPQARPNKLDRATPTPPLLTYSLWAAGAAVLWHALSYYPMWYLIKVSDSKTVGTFYAVRIVTQFVQIGAVMLTTVVAANITRLWEHQGREPAAARLRLLTKASLLVLMGGATLLSLAKPLVMGLFPQSFALGGEAYDPLVLFFLLVGVVGLVAVRLNLLEKPRLICVAWLVGAGVNVIASYVLLGPVGDIAPASQASALQSAAWAGVAGAAAALVVCIGLTSRENLPLDLPSSLLAVAGFSVGFGWRAALPVCLLLTVVVFATSSILSPQERAELRVSLGRAADR